ncbi:hypothetical protein [Mailhella massiliensis]|uniref:hypothetical protein n=1 Tax=Mailhella massiliensis TaxID=1903261 RepID=UPI0011860A89|nr:hypothetical protein [Mailhella massiliensis]
MDRHRTPHLNFFVYFIDFFIYFMISKGKAQLPCMARLTYKEKKAVMLPLIFFHCGTDENRLHAEGAGKRIPLSGGVSAANFCASVQHKVYPWK